VSSAIRCWTSWLAGRFLRPYRKATQITKGNGASATSASDGFTAIITAAAMRIVSADCSMKMRP
jgi:tetrahydromethanopterin S-methyltransferase subunit D